MGNVDSVFDLDKCKYLHNFCFYPPPYEGDCSSKAHGLLTLNTFLREYFGPFQRTPGEICVLDTLVPPSYLLTLCVSLTVLAAFVVLHLFLEVRNRENSYELRILATIAVVVYSLAIYELPHQASQQPQNNLIAVALGSMSAALFYPLIRKGFLWVAEAFTAAAIATGVITLVLLYAFETLYASPVSAISSPDLRLLSLTLLFTFFAFFCKRFREFEVGYVRILEIPENYLTRQKNHSTHRRPDDFPVSENTEARGLIQAMVAKGRFAFITGFVKGVGKMFFIVKGGEQAANYLGASYESQIPGLKTAPAKRVEIVVPNTVVVHLAGRARPLVDAPLEAVYEQLVQRELNGFVYVYVKPHSPLHEKVYLLRRRRALGKLTQKKAKRRDYQISLREKRLRLEIEYGLVGLGVYVVVSGETPEEAKRNAETLAGSLASGMENPKYLKIVSGWRARRILEKLLRLKCGAHTNISRWEASALLQLPRRDVGVRIKKTATFAHTPTPKKSLGLPVGSLMRDGRKLDREVFLELVHLDSHMLIVGATKVGKSNLMLYLCLQLHKRGVNFVVIEPIKQEYRSLLNHMDINIFTAGDETVCPLRFNPLEVTEGIQVGTHISNLVDIFRYVFYLWHPLPQLLRMALVQTYRKKGWDIRRNIRGQTPTLIDLCNELEEIVEKSGYEDRVRHNILAALITRMRSLTVDNLGEMLVPKKTMPFKVLEEKPTIIELQSLGEEDRTLVASLLLNWIYENQRVKEKWRRKRGVSLLCIIEEAHRIVGNRRRSIGEEDTHVMEFSSKTLSQLLSEARAFGLSVALVDQYPGRLPEDAIKNTHTKFVLHLPDEEDRRRIGLSIGLEPEQMRAILDFETGVTILWNFGEPVKQVKVPKLEELGYNLKAVSDEAVKAHMDPLYRKYGWREHNPLVDVIPSEIYTQHRSHPQGPAAEKNSIDLRVHKTVTRVVETSKFSRIYQRLNQPPYRELKRFLEKTAENIANRHKAPDKKEEILNLLQKAAAEKHPQRGE